MNPGLLSLKSTIGNQRTLVIACQECNLEHEETAGVYFYTTLGNMLYRYDILQQDIIRHYIEDKGCTQIIVCGHHHCGILDHILQDNTSRSVLNALQFNLIIAQKGSRLIRSRVREQILVELNIIQQCNLLMEYDFIRERVEIGNLKIVGAIITPDDDVFQLYCNGFSYNNLISLN
ncbi:MAG TPA: carbonic anhydrase [Ohtaekwangia sp.]